MSISETVLSCEGVTLTSGSATIVKDVSFAVRPGAITLLAGPNGAGKSTLLSIACGLLRPTSGRVTIFGQQYANMGDPIFSVGAFLNAEWLDATRSARTNLVTLAQAAGISSARVDEVLELCGLTAAAGRSVKGFSLGMRQRTGIAAALLGSPELLILDEPANGLDPLGMAWMRDLLAEHRSRGGSVLLSSHLLRDAEDLCDDLVVLAHGEVQWSGPLSQFGGEGAVVTEFASSGWEAIAKLLNVDVEHVAEDRVRVAVAPIRVSQAARQAGVDLSYLVPQRRGLEESFQALVSGKDTIR